jgi:hypothetical protein
MKKLMMIFGLLVAVPAVAMELSEIAQLIKPEESQKFARHLGMAVGFGLKMVAEKKVSEHNPIYVMLSKLSNDLVQHDNDITKLMAADQDFADRVFQYKLIDIEPVIFFGINQVHKEKGDVKGARDLVVLNRQILTGLKLQSKWPAYSQQWTGEVKTPDRIEFMQRNEEYPLNEDAIKDYIALFTYQSLLAPKI